MKEQVVAVQLNGRVFLRRILEDGRIMYPVLGTWTVAEKLRPEAIQDYLEPLISRADAVLELELPSRQEISSWISEAAVPALDGCLVEPDGECPHGWPSWLLALGLV